MTIQIIAAPHCKLRAGRMVLVWRDDLRKQGHDVAIVAQNGQQIRTVPSIIVNGVVLDVETAEDLDVARITSTKALEQKVPEPTAEAVLLRALAAKVTKKELDQARAELMPKAAVVEEVVEEKVP